MKTLNIFEGIFSRNQAAEGFDSRTIFNLSVIIVILSAVAVAVFGVKSLIIPIGAAMIFLAFKYELFLLYLLLATVQFVLFGATSVYTVYIYFLVLAIMFLWVFRKLVLKEIPVNSSPFLLIFFIIFYFVGVLSALKGGITKDELYVLARFAIFIPFIFILYDMIHPKHTLKLLIAATIPIFWSCVLVLYQFITSSGILSILELYSDRMAGIFTNGNTFAGSIILLFPFWLAMSFGCKRRSIKYISIIIVLVLTLALILTNSRAALSGFAVTILLFAIWMRKLKYYIAIVSLVVIVLSVNPIARTVVSVGLRVESGSSGRIEAWKNTIDMIKINPFFGIGMGNFRNEYDEYYKTGWERSFYSGVLFHAHNQLLSKTAELGIMGLIMMLILYYYPIRKGKILLDRMKNIENRNVVFGLLCGIIAMYVRSLFEARAILEAGAIYPEILFWILFILLIKMSKSSDISENIIFGEKPGI